MQEIMRETVTSYARQIADSIIESARTSEDDPIAWVTGNAYMPPLRSFTLAENIWQLYPDGDPDGDAFQLLTELVDEYVVDASVALECPDWDNALYAVDLRRFEYEEYPDGETLQDDWRPREDDRAGTTFGDYSDERPSD
jgi:hypothetical protein